MAEAVPHQALSDGPKPFEGSGKDVYKPHVAPIQSINPTSEPQGQVDRWGDKENHQIIAEPNLEISHTQKVGRAKYPFSDLDAGAGMYIPVEPNMTTDKLMESLYKEVANARMEFSEIERDEDGNEIWDVVIVKTRKRNEDGTFQMGAYGKPLEGANQTMKPRLVFSRHFAVKAVVKGDDLGSGVEAPHDGALVVRQV